MRWLKSILFWRILASAVFIAVLVMAVRVLFPGEAVTKPEPQAGEVGVHTAITIAERDPLTVRGYVFVGPGGLGLRLCDGRRNLDPPQCLGPYLDLDGVDEGTFALRRGEVDGLAMQYPTDSIALRGTIVGTRMRVLQVLS